MGTLTPKPSKHLEECASCNQPTGYAGAGEDSRYSEDGNRGPLCDACDRYEEAVIAPLQVEVKQLRSFLREIIGFMDINRIESMDAEDARAWLQAHKEGGDA